MNVGVGIVRSKALALMLGPAGFGLLGLYWSIMNLAASIAGMGVNTAGVRQIAAAAGSGDSVRIAQTAAVLRRTSVALGLLGALSLLGLSGVVSRLTFGGNAYTVPVALLSLGVLFRTVSGGQGALIQGLRRISDLAMSGVIGGLFGGVTSIALVYYFRDAGIVPSLIAIEAMSLLLSWWFSRRLRFRDPVPSPIDGLRETRALLGLGLAFMASSMLAMGAAYAVRMIIARQVGLEAAGLYQSAWTVGGLYVGFILQAMGADFYPRLTSVADDPDKCNRLVNEQTQIGLLLAGPGLLATMTFAPLVLSLFYSTRFLGASDLLRWLCLGVALRVVTWPLGFVPIARARQAVFLAIDLTYTLAYLALAWTGVRAAGLDGSGIAFAASYVLHGLLVYIVARHLTAFQWSRANRRRAVSTLLLAGAIFAGFKALPLTFAFVLGAVATLALTCECLATLRHKVPNITSLQSLRQSLDQRKLHPRRQITSRPTNADQSEAPTCANNR